MAKRIAVVFVIRCREERPNTDYGRYNRSTKTQKDFISSWAGQVRIVESAEEAIELVTKSYDVRGLSNGN